MKRHRCFLVETVRRLQMSDSLILRSASPWFYSQFISAQLLPFRQHPTYENLLFVKRLKLSKYSKQNQLYLSLYHELLQQIIWTLLPVVKSSPPADTWSASCLYKPHMLIKHQAGSQLVLILKASRRTDEGGASRTVYLKSGGKRLHALIRSWLFGVQVRPAVHDPRVLKALQKASCDFKNMQLTKRNYSVWKTDAHKHNRPIIRPLTQPAQTQTSSLCDVLRPAGSSLFCFVFCW